MALTPHQRELLVQAVGVQLYKKLSQDALRAEEVFVTLIEMDAPTRRATVKSWAEEYRALLAAAQSSNLTVSSAKDAAYTDDLAALDAAIANEL